MKGIDRQQESYEGRERFGFVWWGWLVWRGGLLFVAANVGVLITITYLFVRPGPWQVWIVLLPLWGAWLFMVALGTNTATPVTLDADGLWIRVFLRPKFIPWRDVQMLMYRRFPGHIVYCRYISPVHTFVAAPGRQSFALVLGLAHREELFWEIHRTASRAHGSDIPILGWTGRQRR
ncbi:MAG: hypothetical protein M1358_00495 [Chloroflexi bacterium]|nr:hypothetical protein [Chloroflexota bacterium]